MRARSKTQQLPRVDGDSPTILDDFRHALVELMKQKFSGHWHPEQPDRGQAFRSICCDRLCLDALLEKAAARTGMRDIRQRFSADTEILMWCDPGNVTVR